MTRRKKSRRWPAGEAWRALSAVLPPSEPKTLLRMLCAQLLHREA